MYRKIVWCYIIVLTLLDIPLNTKLSAQGKSHGNGVSVHESLMEGYSLQDWGSDGGGEGEGGAGVGRGRAIPAGTLQLAPARLAFGRAALATPHQLTVTITNTANETIHLASVAGTTPDFHSSFFDSKTLAPQANTSFSVVYLGRREGPVSAYLYIHTSKGIYKYPVSAVGVASEYRVWPLVGVRVPHNASLEPTLTLYNPTDTTIQVREVYSSGSWVGLALPGGGGGGAGGLHAAAWAVPPHAERPLVRLRLRPPPAPGGATAYVRVRWSGSGVALVVAVSALATAAGEYVQPAAVRLAVRGSRDPPETFPLHAGNSGDLPRALHAALEGAACSPLHEPRDEGESPAPPAPPQHNGRAPPPGADVTLLYAEQPPRSLPGPVTAQLTLHYEKLWASAGGGAAEGARCGGWVRLGRAATPYSLTLLPGTLTPLPPQLHFVTANVEAALERRELRAHNQFPVPLRVHDVHFPDEVQLYFYTEKLTPVVVGAGERAAVARLRLRTAALAAELSAHLVLATNHTQYRVPLLLYSGKLHIEWDWPRDSWSSEALDLGVVPLGGVVEVSGRVRGGGASVPRASAQLAGGEADLTLTALADEEGGPWLRAVLRVRAPRAEGAARGRLEVRSAHAAADLTLLVTAAAGSLRLLPLDLPPAAPYVWGEAALVADSSLALRMRVLRVTQPPPPDPALSATLEEGEGAGEVEAGARAVARVRYSPELACRPHCYTGLHTHTTEGAAWVRRGSEGAGAGALAEDAALARERRARLPARPWTASLVVHTSGVRRVATTVRVPPLWPRLAAPRAALQPRAAVASPAPLRIDVVNPSSSHPLLLQFVLHPHRLPLGEDEDEEREHEGGEGGEWGESFAVSEWRGVRGGAAAWRDHAGYVVLAPRAHLALTLTFTPRAAAPHATYLYIRNNLTIVERVSVSGVGAHPTFEVGGRKPNSTSALVVEVTECGAEGAAGAASRALTVRNTGVVPLRLRGWRVAGVPCGARGFRLQPCAALALQPNESRALHLTFAADWTRARVGAVLTVRAGPRLAAFQLAGAVAARTLARCAPAARRPPFEPALRALGAALALLALAGAAALAAADAERALRRHRAARAAPPPPRAPLDLRALARPAPPAPVSAPAPRRRRTPRRRAAPQLDPAAERRAFERWRAEVERRSAGDTDAAPLHDDEDSRSEEEEDAAPPAPSAPRPPHSPHEDTSSSSSPDSSPPPRDNYSMSSRLDDAEEEEEEEEEMEEGGSTVSETSSGGDERSEGDSAAAAPPAPPPPPASPPRAHSAACLDPLCSHHEAGGRRAARAPPAPRAALRPAPRRVRRRERPVSPPRTAPRAEPRPGAPSAVRWGTASWSSVVSRGPEAQLVAPRPAPPPPAPRPLTPPPPPADPVQPPPLAPIGSDVRRRLGSHSLFFYSGETGGASASRWPPSEERPPEARWAAGEGPAAAWGWGTGGGAVRPPPGFPLPRVYDPFHSLASIWTPAALDWRADPPTPPLDDKFDPTVPPPPLPTPPAPPPDRSNNNNNN